MPKKNLVTNLRKVARSERISQIHKQSKLKTPECSIQTTVDAETTKCNLRQVKCNNKKTNKKELSRILFAKVVPKVEITTTDNGKKKITIHESDNNQIESTLDKASEELIDDIIATKKNAEELLLNIENDKNVCNQPIINKSQMENQDNKQQVKSVTTKIALNKRTSKNIKKSSTKNKNRNNLVIKEENSLPDQVNDDVDLNLTKTKRENHSIREKESLPNINKNLIEIDSFNDEIIITSDDEKPLSFDYNNYQDLIYKCKKHDSISKQFSVEDLTLAGECFKYAVNPSNFVTRQPLCSNFKYQKLPVPRDEDKINMIKARFSNSTKSTIDNKKSVTLSVTYQTIPINSMKSVNNDNLIKSKSIKETKPKYSADKSNVEDNGKYIKIVAVICDKISCVADKANNEKENFKKQSTNNDENDNEDDIALANYVREVFNYLGNIYVDLNQRREELKQTIQLKINNLGINDILIKEINSIDELRSVASMYKINEAKLLKIKELEILLMQIDKKEKSIQSDLNNILRKLPIDYVSKVCSGIDSDSSSPDINIRAVSYTDNSTQTDQKLFQDFEKKSNSNESGKKQENPLNIRTKRKWIRKRKSSNKKTKYNNTNNCPDISSTENKNENKEDTNILNTASNLSQAIEHDSEKTLVVPIKNTCTFTASSEDINETEMTSLSNTFNLSEEKLDEAIEENSTLSLARDKNKTPILYKDINMLNTRFSLEAIEHIFAQFFSFAKSTTKDKTPELFDKHMEILKTTFNLPQPKIYEATDYNFENKMSEENNRVSTNDEMLSINNFSNELLETSVALDTFQMANLHDNEFYDFEHLKTKKMLEMLQHRVESKNELYLSFPENQETNSPVVKQKNNYAQNNSSDIDVIKEVIELDESELHLESIIEDTYKSEEENTIILNLTELKPKETLSIISEEEKKRMDEYENNFMAINVSALNGLIPRSPYYKSQYNQYNKNRKELNEEFADLFQMNKINRTFKK